MNKNQMVDISENQNFQNMLEQIQDYMDTDSLRLLNGMEKEDYLRIGNPFLPKNQEPEYREEFMMIPGIRDFYSKFSASGNDDFFQVIPPANMQSLPYQVNLYSSSMDLIDMAADLSDIEREELEKALELWRTEQTLLTKSLKSNLLKKLEGKVVTKESGWYRVRLNLQHQKQSTSLSASFNLESGSSYPIEYMEYFVY